MNEEKRHNNYLHFSYRLNQKGLASERHLDYILSNGILQYASHASPRGILIGPKLALNNEKF